MADNLRVKEVAVAPGGDGDGDDGARTQRFVICHNPEQAERDRQVRTNLVAHLQQLIEGSNGWTGRRRDELVGSLNTKPGLRRYLRRTTAGQLRIDHAAIRRERHLDGAGGRPRPSPAVDHRSGGRRAADAHARRARGGHL